MKKTILLFILNFHLLIANDWFDFQILINRDTCFIASLQIDEDNNKWFGSYKHGLIKYSNNNFQYFIDTTLTWDYIFPRCIINNSIWCKLIKDSFPLGVDIGAVNYNIKTGTFNYINMSNAPFITNSIDLISADSLNNMWFSIPFAVNSYHPLYSWDGTNWMIFDDTNSPLTYWNKIQAIKTAPDSTVWFATTDGLLSYKNDAWQKYTPGNSGLISKYVEDIDFDSKGRIWIANFDGLVFFDGVHWVKYDTTNSPLPYFSGGVSSILAIDSNNNIWADTQKFLESEIVKYDSKNWTFFNKSNSILNDVIFDIIVDKFNNKWIYTGDGYYIYRIYREGGVILDSPEISNNQIHLENYPNPFSESTTIEFNLEANCEVRLSVFNFLGQEVAVLVNQFLPAGQHSAKFDGTNLPQGTYFYKLQAGGEVWTGKVLLINNWRY
jgi:hypothetical protein